MKLRSALLTATLLATPAVAMAQPVSGLYIGGGAGFDYLNSLNGKNLVIPVPNTPNQTLPINSANLKSNGGFVGLASIGWGFGNGLRLEVEGNYRQNQVHVGNSNIVGGGAQFQQYGAMVNGLFDFDVGSPFVYPYAGIGFGYIENQLHGGRIYTTGAFAPTVPQVAVDFTNSAKGSAAGQGILGAAFPMPFLPGLSVTTEFRFIGQFSRQTYSGQTVVPGTSARVVGTSLKLAAPTNESFLVGLRYAFNVPVPPPPPAPAVAAPPAAQPARTYLVFFDWDRYDLTARARQIIAEAAANVAHVQVTRIEVNGYTDLSGPPAYNQKLSVRRAEAVAAELVRDGVSRSLITAQGFGMSNPLVPTALGVREPQNRRVEIILK